MVENNSICNNIIQIKKEIKNYCNIFPLAKKDIKLIVVSKNQDINSIEKAILCGQVDFAENYIQEAESKWITLKQKYPHVKLHLIGNLQKNKVKKALFLFDYIHTIDSIELAKKIAIVIKNESLKDKSFLIQVLLDENSSTKHGLSGISLNNMLIECKNLNLNIIGLMGVAPINNPALYFAYLKNLAEEYSLKELSMGMSGDFIEAIRFGSSMLRLGSIIFGNR